MAGINFVDEREYSRKLKFKSDNNMTPENKQRIVKYVAILAGYKQDGIDALNTLYDKFPDSIRIQTTAIQCSIAEVEAVIRAIDNADTIALNFGHDYHQEIVNLQAELAELKQLL